MERGEWREEERATPTNALIIIKWPWVNKKKEEKTEKNVRIRKAEGNCICKDNARRMFQIHKKKVKLKIKINIILKININ